MQWVAVVGASSREEVELGKGGSTGISWVPVASVVVSVAVAVAVVAVVVGGGEGWFRAAMASVSGLDG